MHLAIQVMLIALLTNIATLTVTRQIMRPSLHRLSPLRKEIEDLMRELMRERDEGRLKKKRERLRQIQMFVAKETLRQQLKLFLIFPPFFIIFLFFIVPQFYPANLVVAALPFHFPWLGTVSGLKTELTFIAWYMICYIGFSFPLSRIFGVAQIK